MSADQLRETKIAVARDLYRTLAAGDREGLQGLLHPSFTGHAAEGLPLDMGGDHAGIDAMCDNLWWRIGQHFRARAVPEEFQSLEDGRLMVVGNYRGSARGSGNPLDAAFIHVLTFASDERIDSLYQLTDTAAWHAALDGPDRLQTINFHVDAGLATVCLNRPEARNAIDLRMAEETLEVARRIAADSSIRAVLICGSGPALTVGGDISYFLANSAEGLGNLSAKMTAPFHQGFDILSRINAPIVTAAHGAIAGGGLGYVYAADIVVASEDARFVTAFSGIGLSGDGGGTWHLPRLIGPRRAAAAYMRNTPIGATEALEWGLVNEVVPVGELRSRATELAVELASGPTVAFGVMRSLLRDSWRNDLPTQLAAETRGVRLTGESKDAAHAMQAFVDKRVPTYVGR
ncbi:enoyl-CoA hydratase [Mycobacteroides abscessus subsp. bolletii]|uniref:enoyl-CoA hydratase-related protein n=1 Tax=Mycobacteroides abscessus TaxID=36809 RepID=UPI0002ED1A16|nr:enoyl-CoA hydratase-related protein [Mycobacteroides abscessus]SHO90113.1 enoyl-CoA hydratase [Mycobacteroides abscessus subsp. abscessus]SHZ22717.1 enoyl-CoA hydratase [Mycobacteroides abscessus subsp. bolletii]SIE27443.1 enoyl-CoA hydratase [Mycobacteroides abscessus subsp. abscessus]SIH99740.1 enoyl-CoA hydratase [Mycobacteroides abscessus subsp. abscessus]SKF71404.1 enoyl-CoA hydratase [Mycobacteroides abscessus subsp. bolletii]